jgi:hypothetical protein
VKAYVEEGEKAEHASKADELGEIEKFTERSDAESEDKEAKSPIASLMLEEFDRIGSEIAANSAPNEKQKWKRREYEE